MTLRPYTMFQRLVADPENGLEFDYMGAAEYEFGTAHAGVGIMVTDIPAPKETITTNIVVKREDTPLHYMTGPRRRQSKKAFQAELDAMKNLSDMCDDQPLLFRHIPGITPAENMNQMMSLTRIGVEHVQNAGGGTISHRTEAWLTLHPVIGILYHPSKEEMVNTFVEKLGAIKSEKIPDATERARDVIKKLEKLDNACDDAARRDLLNSLDDSPSP